jgi:hypothetical protein
MLIKFVLLAEQARVGVKDDGVLCEKKPTESLP